jgi:Rrf2 family protein
MKLSRASSYALHAVVHMAAEGEGRLLASHLIAEARGISERFLMKLLRSLVSAQILRSVKGPNGGYQLARPAAKITMLEVVEAVDGPIRGQLDLVGEGADAVNRQLEAIWGDTTDRVRRHLGKVRISELAGKS